MTFDTKALKMESEATKIEILAGTLYDTITQHGSSTRLFTQSELLDMGVIPKQNVMLLMQAIQKLTNDKLLVGVVSGPGMLAWRYRSREDAKKYASLPDETTVLVYQAIDEAGNDGIWKRTIENRINISDAVMKACIKILEQKGYIASMRSVEQPNRKMYIRADLRPSERATGGPWFTDGQLDAGFIEELQGVIFEFIKTKGSYRQASGVSSAGGAVRTPKNGAVTASMPVLAGSKRSAREMASDDVTPISTPARSAAGANMPSRPARKPDMYLPYPAGYKQYPTIADITEFIHETGITNNATLGESDIKQLVDVLCYDGLIEKVKMGKRKGYRVLKPTKQTTIPYSVRAKERSNGIGLDLPQTGVLPSTTGLTEAPCARCPVFKLCEEGGTVSPSNCVYFKEWLGLEERKKKVDEAGNDKASAPP